MTITRDPKYPVEIAQLIQAFNMAADGVNAATVLNASAQMLAAGIGLVAKNEKLHLDQAFDYADQFAAMIKAEIRNNWQRRPEATDVVVKPS
jgi:hypothetical protein